MESLPTLPAPARRELIGLVWMEGRPPEVAAFEAAMVAFFVEAATLLGVPKSMAALYGICFAAPEPLAFADIEARLDLSKGSISQGLRALREVGALRTVSVPGDRRERFVPDIELRKLILRWIEERLEKQLTAGQGRLEELARSVPAGRTAPGRMVRERVRSLQNWHHKGRAVLPVMKSLLKLT